MPMFIGQNVNIHTRKLSPLSLPLNFVVCDESDYFGIHIHIMDDI